MILEMKHLTLFTTASSVKRTLEVLRDAGCVHLDLAGASSASVVSARAELAATERAIGLIERAHRVLPEAKGEFPSKVEDILALGSSCAAIESDIDELSRTIAEYEPYGDFDPQLARKLLDAGVDIASVAKLPDVLPPKRLGEMRDDLARLKAEALAKKTSLAAAGREIDRFRAKIPVLREQMEFAAAAEKMASALGGISWITGWIPKESVPKLRALAAKFGWGFSLRNPEVGEIPPTLIRPPKLFRSVRALFDGLGIAPGYTEADVSVPFMCYFSLFFAMLVGDGGYGAIFLAGTIWAWVKTRPLKKDVHRPLILRSWLTLMTVFSGCTIIWGGLSNTWFGVGLPFLRDLPTAVWLADPSYNNMMLLCFTIGVSHLAIARLWSAFSILNDTRCLAEFGWAGIVVFMYMVTNSIVGIFPGVPQWAMVMGMVSLALVFLFSLKPCELKTRGIELGMLPLNVMSCLGDIISYVRLFAVGLASVKVAENFNAMALDLDLPLWIKWLPLVVILIIGHGLNLAMAALSVLVHAVRLNTLEFSNHKGVSWSGYGFSPFRRNK